MRRGAASSSSRRGIFAGGDGVVGVWRRSRALWSWATMLLPVAILLSIPSVAACIASRHARPAARQAGGIRRASPPRPRPSRWAVHGLRPLAEGGRAWRGPRRQGGWTRRAGTLAGCQGTHAGEACDGLPRCVRPWPRRHAPTGRAAARSVGQRGPAPARRTSFDVSPSPHRGAGSQPHPRIGRCPTRRPAREMASAGAAASLSRGQEGVGTSTGWPRGGRRPARRTRGSGPPPPPGAGPMQLGPAALGAADRTTPRVGGWGGGAVPRFPAPVPTGPPRRPGAGQDPHLLVAVGGPR